MQSTYLMPTQEAGRNFVKRNLQGSVVMLNLLRFRTVADYATAPELAPEIPISGREAYQLYMNHTLPFLKESGGEIVLMGESSDFLIGPPEERWDAVLLVKQHSVGSFLSFESNPAYLNGIGHRTAALEDARLLPITKISLSADNRW